MGDTDILGEDYDFFYDDDWLYIEDEFAIADELAETQIPSPGYSGTNAELMHERYEYDTYEYFGELEYGDDAFWDVALAKTKQEQEQREKQSLRKRKRAASVSRIGKRCKLEGQRERLETDREWQTVVYRQTTPSAKSVPTVDEKIDSFALFPDWRQRFPIDADMEWHSSMPDDMQRAAQAGNAIENQDEDQDDDNSQELSTKGAPRAIEQPIRQSKKRKTTRMSLRAEDAGGQSTHGLEPAFDNEAIRTILRSKLGNAGLDEEVFMTVISNMLAGVGSTDDAVAQLADALLEQRNDDNNAALSWLQDNGVNMAQADKEQDSEGLRVDSGAGFANEATLDRLAVIHKDLGKQLSQPDDPEHHTEEGREDTRDTKHSGGER